MNQNIKNILGDSYSWDETFNELNYRGSPLNESNQTDFEKRAVKQAESLLIPA